MRCWLRWRGSPRRSWDRRSSVSFRQACCRGRACRLQASFTSSSMRSCRTPPMARCCASRGARFTLVSPKPSKANSRKWSRASQDLLARHYTEAGLIEKAASLWGRAGTTVSGALGAVGGRGAAHPRPDPNCLIGGHPRLAPRADPSRPIGLANAQMQTKGVMRPPTLRRPWNKRAY